ncbi:MAG: hypothetical protein Q8Q65_01835 [bacterium]|nr:hypothetical protein [bacterium]
MNLNNISLLNIFNGITATGIAKFMIISVAFMYIFFAFALWRQISLMMQSINLGASSIFKLVGILHLFLAIGVFILGLILL